MSIFSKMKNAKKAADQHKDSKAQAAAPAEDKPKEAPYKHVPSHALQDALAGVPSAFREQDRELIKEHNKRRSQMTRNSSYMSTASAANSIHNLPRNVSRHSVDSFGTRLSGQQYGPGDAKLTPHPNNRPPIPRLATPNLDVNRSRLSRSGPSESYLNRQPVGKSPLASEDISPAESSGNSTSSGSSQILEIPAALHGGHSSHPNPLVPQRRVHSEQFSTRPPGSNQYGGIQSRFLQQSTSTYKPDVRVQQQAMSTEQPGQPGQMQPVVNPPTADMPTAQGKKRKSVFSFGKRLREVAAY